MNNLVASFQTNVKSLLFIIHTTIANAMILGAMYGASLIIVGMIAYPFGLPDSFYFITGIVAFAWFVNTYSTIK